MNSINGLVVVTFLLENLGTGQLYKGIIPESYNINHNFRVKYDNRTDVVRLRRQSSVQACEGDVSKFQCPTTTECIGLELKCDGKIDCPDGGDENKSLCKEFPKKCTTPPKLANGHWINLSNSRNDYLSSHIDENSVLKYWCSPGYKLSTTIENSLLVHCLPAGKLSLTVLPVCQKLCQSLRNSPLITVSCKNDGSFVRCDQATDNTIVTYECAPYYEAPYGRPRSSTCYGGIWDYIPDCIPVCGEKRVSATPLIVNGKEVERGHYPWAVALYSSKDSDPYFTNICGGSLLSTKIVLTAAHCVSRKETGKKHDARYFQVAAGKYYLNFEDPRDIDTAQYTEVDSIETHGDYRGELQNFRGDIALLKLKTNLVLSKVVQPVCYNNLPTIPPNTVGLVTGWGYTNSSGEPSETLKELELPYNADEQCLKDLDQDFSNRYFISDKLCAGFNDQNTSVCNGDSGGGLVFINPYFKRRYFIHGIVSLAHSYRDNQKVHCNIQRNALFTKVENYIEWIQLKVRHWTGKKCRAPAKFDYGGWAYLNGNKDASNQEIDTNTAIILSCDPGYQLSTKEDNIVVFCMPTGKWNVTVMPVCEGQRITITSLGGGDCSSNKGTCKLLKKCPGALSALKNGIYPQRCGFEGTEPLVCCASKMHSIAELEKSREKYRLPGEVSNQKCDEYSEYVWKETNQSTPLVHERNECPFNRQKRIAGGVPASRREFPHMVQLGYDIDKDIKWLCCGSLISDKYVLTAAQCLLEFSVNRPKYARMGIVDLNSNDHLQQYNISEIIPHPKYDGQSIYNDIGLVKLDKRVKLDTWVRPACLYTKNDSSWTNVIAAGWDKTMGKINYAGQQSTTLQTVILELYDQPTCNKAYKGKIVDWFKLNEEIKDEIMICAGSSTGLRGTCQADAGGPIQVYRNGNQLCMYEVVGINFFGPTCGLTNIPSVYTRVSYYIKWIEDIVWPLK